MGSGLGLAASVLASIGLLVATSTASSTGPATIGSSAPAPLTEQQVLALSPEAARRWFGLEGRARITRTEPVWHYDHPTNRTYLGQYVFRLDRGRAEGLCTERIVSYAVQSNQSGALTPGSKTSDWPLFWFHPGDASCLGEAQGLIGRLAHVRLARRLREDLLRRAPPVDCPDSPAFCARALEITRAIAVSPRLEVYACNPPRAQDQTCVSFGGEHRGFWASVEMTGQRQVQRLRIRHAGPPRSF